MLIEVKNGEMFDVNINLKDELRKEYKLTYPQINQDFKEIKAFAERNPIQHRVRLSAMEILIRRWFNVKYKVTT